MRTVQFLSVGRLSYGQALKLQNLISEGVKEKKLPDTLILVEHDPVYTVGIRDKSYTKDDEKKLVSLGAEFFRTNRGGFITFHGPGQMVIYPIVDLRNFGLGIRNYVSTLERTIIDLCDTFGLKATTSPYTGTHSLCTVHKDEYIIVARNFSFTTPGRFLLGVWIGDNKICALGIHASRFVTTHGLALNCNTDLKWFSHIVPCGIKGKFVTSLSEQLKCNVTIDSVVPKFKDSFSKLFHCEILDTENSQDLDAVEKLVK